MEAKTGDLIVKAVNLQPQAAQTDIVLNDFAAKRVETTEMSGFDKEDVNTFAEPFKVCPRTYDAEVSECMTWTFPPESMTILRFKKV